jgi:hypothetical protein
VPFGIDSASCGAKEDVMSERATGTDSSGSGAANAPGTAEARQPPRLSDEEIAQLEAYEEIEDFMSEPPEGALGVISDQDVPGEPG